MVYISSSLAHFILTLTIVRYIYILAAGPRKFEVLSAILESGRESFLLHNVCQKYLSFMWMEKGFMVYSLNLFIYLIFHVLFNIYVMLVRGAIARGIYCANFFYLFVDKPVLINRLYQS